MTGILLRRQNKYWVVISVDLIMRSVAVEVEASDVMPMRSSTLNAIQGAAGRKTTLHV
jgi:hypothetical protein